MTPEADSSRIRFTRFFDEEGENITRAQQVVKIGSREIIVSDTGVKKGDARRNLLKQVQYQRDLVGNSH